MNSTPNQAGKIRWMIRRDLDRVSEIDQRAFRFRSERWTDKVFIERLRSRKTIGHVIESHLEVVGYMVYGLQKNSLEIQRIAVDPIFQRQGFGSAMIDKLVGKLGRMKRNKLVAFVHESNLESQLFFRDTGFLAKQTVRNFCDDAGDDYLFERTNSIPSEVS